MSSGLARRDRIAPAHHDVGLVALGHVMRGVDGERQALESQRGAALRQRVAQRIGRAEARDGSGGDRLASERREKRRAITSWICGLRRSLRLPGSSIGARSDMVVSSQELGWGAGSDTGKR